MFKISIKPLFQCLSTVPRLVSIWQDVLGRRWLPGTCSSSLAKSISANISSTDLPITMVALHDKKPVGMVTLSSKDGLESDLTPWLSDLVVCADYHGKGVGSSLMREAIDITRLQGYDSLHLFTFDAHLPKYYKRFGWECIGKDTYKTHPVIIMKIRL